MLDCKFRQIGMEHDWGLNSDASPEAMFQQANGPRWRSNNPRLRMREATLNDDATLRLWLHVRGVSCRHAEEGT